MKTKKYFKSMILPLIVSGLFVQTLAWAQENLQTQSTYSNTAQANQAAQKAKQAANTTNPSLQAALNDINAAEGQLGHSQMSGDQVQMMAAETALSNAEDTYTSMLSKMSGVSQMDISDMHTAGVGWSDVAGELGIHGTSGQMASNSKGSMGGSNMTGKSGQGAMQMNGENPGSMMGSQSSEIMSATPRNTAPGQTMGHGSGMKTGVQNNAKGGMMSGAGGLGGGNGMGGATGESNSGGMSGGMGDGGSGNGGGGGGMM